jgi:hypothetical protein
MILEKANEDDDDCGRFSYLRFENVWKHIFQNNKIFEKKSEFVKVVKAFISFNVILS